IALVGFGNSLWHPTAIPTLGRRYPERKGLVLSVHGMGGNVGDAIAPLVLGSIRLGAKNTSGEGQSLGQYMAGLRELFRNRALVMLSTGSSFRTMTQS